MPDPNPEPPHASTHSQEADNMATHSLTQTRHSVDTQPTASVSQNLVNHIVSLDMLLGNNTHNTTGVNTPQPPPAGGIVPQQRIEETIPSSPQLPTITRGDQAPHSIPGGGSTNLQTHTTHGIHETPRRPARIDITPVGDEILQQASIRDRNCQHPGLWYNPGDEWDHTNLSLIGNTIVQDQRITEQREEMTRYRPTQQTEDWNSRMATIAHVNPVSWSIKETAMVQNALDAMLRGGPGRSDDRRDIQKWFQLYDQSDSSASSSNTGGRDHYRSQSYSRRGRPTSPPRQGMVSAHEQAYNK